MSGQTDELSFQRLAAAAREAIPGGTLLSVRNVTAGTSARVRELVVAEPTGEIRRFIVRWFTVEWQGSPRAKVERERLALSTLAGSDLPVPRVLWADPAGNRLGHPAIIQTRLPGRVRWVQAIRPAAAAAMGRALAKIHAVQAPQGLPRVTHWVRWTMESEEARRQWLGAHPLAETIEEAITSAGGRPLRRRRVLSHGDFNAGNVLWSRGRLSGVVDWETAEAAPRGADVGACRFDCAVTGGQATAEAFLEGYGREVADLWYWELLAALKFATHYREWLPVWHSFGLSHLTVATVRRRIDAGIRTALERAAMPESPQAE